MTHITIEQFIDGYEALKLSPRVQTVYEVFPFYTEALEFTEILLKNRIISPISEVISDESHRLRFHFEFAPDADERCSELIKQIRKPNEK